jgi:hypothetical protein
VYAHRQLATATAESHPCFLDTSHGVKSIIATRINGLLKPMYRDRMGVCKQQDYWNGLLDWTGLDYWTDL